MDFTQDITRKSMDVFRLGQKLALFRFCCIKANKIWVSPSVIVYHRKFPSSNNRVRLGLFCTEKNEGATGVSERACDITQFVTRQLKIFYQVCFRTAIETLDDLIHFISSLNPKEG